MQIITRRSFIKTTTLAGTSAMIFPSTVTGSQTPPNILLITVDDMNYDAITWLGGQIEGLTPNIDRLASQGMRFTQAYNTHSRCSPSRGSMMTGLYQDHYSQRPGTTNTSIRDASSCAA